MMADNSNSHGMLVEIDILKDYFSEEEQAKINAKMRWRGRMRAAQINDVVMGRVFGDVEQAVWSEVNHLVNEPYGLESYQ